MTHPGKKAGILLAIMAIANISNAVACGMAGYGTIGASLFGTVLSPYTVYNNVTGRVQIVTQYGGAPRAVAALSNASCSIISGNNLTLLASNSIIASYDNFGEAVKGRLYQLTILSSWTVAYNAKLKSSISGSGSWKNPEEKSPANGGGGSFDVSFNYEYSSSNSGFVSYYCGVTAI